MQFVHIPVMLEECMKALNLKEGGVYFDATLGGASHTMEILKRTSPSGRVVATDLDEEAIANAKVKLSDYLDRIKIFNTNYKNFNEVKNLAGIDGFDGALMDLGVSSYQLDNRSRGFSYMANDSVLDMRMSRNSDKSAWDVVNKYDKSKLAYILSVYGEEKFAENIAANIVKARQVKPIDTTGELVEIIDRSIPFKFKQNGHPAKKSFQAIRIEVNEELDGLDAAIKDIIRGLKKGSHVAIITFHSLEDAIVKRTFKDLETDCICDKRLPICVCNKKREIKILTKKPIEPSEEELERNPRSKSAKLRVAEKL